MTKEEMKKILPHREPMLLVDEAIQNDDGTATGRYTVRGDEYFLQGHFPDLPVVPGVILCEMASQSACLLMADKVAGKITFFAGMDNVKFKRSVKPGETVEFLCEHVRSLGPFHVVKAKGSVDGMLCMSGEFTYALIDPKSY